MCFRKRSKQGHCGRSIAFTLDSFIVSDPEKIPVGYITANPPTNITNLITFWFSSFAASHWIKTEIVLDPQSKQKAESEIKKDSLCITGSFLRLPCCSGVVFTSPSCPSAFAWASDSLTDWRGARAAPPGRCRPHGSCRRSWCCLPEIFPAPLWWTRRCDEEEGREPPWGGPEAGRPARLWRWWRDRSSPTCTQRDREGGGLVETGAGMQAGIHVCSGGSVLKRVLWRNVSQEAARAWCKLCSRSAGAGRCWGVPHWLVFKVIHYPSSLIKASLPDEERWWCYSVVCSHQIPRGLRRLNQTLAGCVFQTWRITEMVVSLRSLPAQFPPVLIFHFRGSPVLDNATVYVLFSISP